jgi:ketosteroid isomerase-like protein
VQCRGLILAINRTNGEGDALKAISALLVLLSMPLCLFAMAQDRPSDEQHVRSLDDQERVAALKRDLPALERLWSDQFTVNAPNNQVVVGKRAVLDTFERQIEFIRADGNFVIIMGLETVQPIGDAPSAGLVAGQSIKRRFTNIWKNEEGTWRLFARHANVISAR